ncbi:hypothetical protein DSCA_60920 [Desulfosarcina alkanivorans]|uniref:Uncharacterized protein n=1 Tax=Desulfosarcina alkanivorans TaxID=571177 RepID=A0A5K7YQU9_9BACT|nr:hypothetical protein [Desulfosarcina alkanivorans]BBO72162.1 hypothetical protein DSCA_60920 [Desulfosarcina alkanivorans]
MKSICFFVLVSIFAICGPAYCHTFKATYVSGDGTEAVLRDTSTGDEWMVQVGDEIDGYRVIQITMDHVTIVHPGENGVVYSTDIPIDDEKHTVKVSP